MTNWVSYYFFGPRPFTEIDNLNTLEITAASECHNKVLFGTAQGELWLAMSPGSSAQKTDLKFPSPILHIIAAEYSQRAMIVFKDENNFVFQIYNMSDFSALYEIVVENKAGASDISFLSCSGKLSRFAFTIDRKTILQYSLPSSDRAIERIQRLNIQPETKQIKEGTITGMFLTNDEKLNRYLYVLLNNSIQCYDITSKGGLKLSWTVPEPYSPTEGEELFCVGPKGRLYVCRGKTVTVYINEDKENNIGPHKRKEIILDAHPQKMIWFRQYLVCIYPEEMNKMKIYEPSSHCIFGALPYGDQVKFFLNEWSGLTLIQNDGEVIVLEEPSTEQKIQKLCTRFNQFEIALKIAEKQNLSPAVIASIHKTKGDKSYTRKNFDDAIDEYIMTIGSLEPSYVIKKFLDPQHANQLIRYLEELQTADMSETSTSSYTAKRLHSTLLFNCYAKLRKNDILAEKVQLAVDYAAGNEEPPYDIDSAIEVLTHSGYTSLAQQLADAYNKHDTCMKILYDSGDYMCLFEHFSELTGRKAEDTITKYGSWVLSRMKDDNLRHKFIHLAIDLCIEGSIEEINGQSITVYCNPESFKTVFSLDQHVYHHFLSALCEKDPSKLSQTLWNDYLQTTLSLDIKNLSEVVDHPNANYSTEQALIILQEPAIQLKAQKRKYDEALKANKDDPILKTDIKEITIPLGYINKALISIYEKRRVCTEILNCIPPEQIPSACETYGKNDPHFWLEGLREAERRNQGIFIKDVVRRIHENDLYPLNSLLKPVNAFSEFTFDIFQEFIQEDFTKMQELIESKQQELESLEDQIQKDNETIENLTNNYYTVKPVNCAYCKLPLDRPSYHFLCGHSFHKHCLDGGAEVCRVCKESHIENSKTKIKQIEEAKNEKDILQKLKNSANPQESLNMLLESGFFAPELEFGGEEAVRELAARLEPPPKQIKDE